MGWCSGTEIFDMVVESLIGEKEVNKVDVIKKLSEAMENMDWDCQGDSEFYQHPLVLEARPDWKWEDEA